MSEYHHQRPLRQSEKEFKRLMACEKKNGSTVTKSRKNRLRALRNSAIENVYRQRSLRYRVRDSWDRWHAKDEGIRKKQMGIYTVTKNIRKRVRAMF